MCIRDSFRSLEQLSGLLESYGGHELAAGFTIRRACIEPFREKMLQLCSSFRQSDACSTALAIDCEIPPELLTIENIQALDELEPCGAAVSYTHLRQPRARRQPQAAPAHRQPPGGRDRRFADRELSASKRERENDMKTWKATGCVLLAGIFWGSMGLFVRQLNAAGLYAIDVMQLRVLASARCV